MAGKYTNSNCLICGKLKTKSKFTKHFYSPYCRSCGANEMWKRRGKYADLICRKCGKSFPYIASNAKPKVYCSKECRSRRVNITCEICGKLKNVPASNATRYKHCSIECSMTRAVTGKCARCGKDFRYSKTEIRTYCSEKCRRPPMIVDCLNCSKRFRIRPNLKSENGNFCCFRCYRHFKGESSIEYKTRTILEKTAFDFKQEFVVKTKDVFDFYIPSLNLLIECDGDYWHSLPKAIKKDTQKQKDAEMLGFNVIRFTETEIIQDDFADKLITRLFRL